MPLICIVCDYVFSGSGDVEGVDIEVIAAMTEDCIFNEFKNTEVKYKNRIRSRVANLKVYMSFYLQDEWCHSDQLISYIFKVYFISISTFFTSLFAIMCSGEIKDYRASLAL